MAESSAGAAREGRPVSTSVPEDHPAQPSAPLSGGKRPADDGWPALLNSRNRYSPAVMIDGGTIDSGGFVVNEPGEPFAGVLQDGVFDMNGPGKLCLSLGHCVSDANLEIPDRELPETEPFFTRNRKAAQAVADGGASGSSQEGSETDQTKPV